MEKIIYKRHGKEVHLRIVKALMQWGYRILVDKAGCETTAWIGEYGESDRIFETKEDAEKALISYANNLLEVQAINHFIVY